MSTVVGLSSRFRSSCLSSNSSLLPCISWMKLTRPLIFHIRRISVNFSEQDSKAHNSLSCRWRRDCLPTQTFYSRRSSEMVLQSLSGQRNGQHRRCTMENEVKTRKLEVGGSGLKSRSICDSGTGAVIRRAQGSIIHTFVDRFCPCNVYYNAIDKTLLLTQSQESVSWPP